MTPQELSSFLRSWRADDAAPAPRTAASRGAVPRVHSFPGYVRASRNENLRPRLPLLHRDRRAGHASVRRVKLSAPHGRRWRPTARRPRRRTRTGAPRGGTSGPAPRWAGLVPPGWPIGWRTAPLPTAGFAGARASVCVRAAPAGRGKARPRRGEGAGARRRGAASWPGHQILPRSGRLCTPTCSSAASAPPLCTPTASCPLLQAEDAVA